MVICSRCQQAVDETTQTACPVCFTPLAAPGSAAQPLGAPNASAPPASYTPGAMPLNGPAPTPVALNASPSFNAPPPAPALGANQRMTLTGDVIDAPVPMAAPPAGNSQYKPRTNYTTPQAAETREKSGSNPIVVSLVFLLLFGGGAGGWYYWMHRTNPKDQALKAYRSVLHQEWKTLYTVAALSEEDKKAATDADTFAQTMSSGYQTIGATNPMLKQMVDTLKSNDTTKVGVPVITGGKADVPTSLDLAFGSKSVTMKGVAHMINDGGIWKLDASADPQMKQTVTDLIGKPDAGSLR